MSATIVVPSRIRAYPVGMMNSPGPSPAEPNSRVKVPVESKTTILRLALSGSPPASKTYRLPRSSNPTEYTDPNISHASPSMTPTR